MGCVAITVLRELDLDVSALFTHRDDPNENRWFATPASIAEEMGVPVYYPENINDDRWMDLLKKIEPSIILSCYFRDMIGEEILKIPSVAAVNLHGSLLPKYRGRCPVNWQLVNGEKESGVTLHHMVKKADAGDIVGAKRVSVAETDDAVSLFKKLEIAAGQVLREFIPRLLDGTAPRIKQNHDQSTYFGGRRPEDGRIDWSWDASRIYNLVRAVTWPYPGAFSMLGNTKVMFWKTEVMEMDTALPAGTVFSPQERGGVAVQTGKGVIYVVCATREGVAPENEESDKELLYEGMTLA